MKREGEMVERKGEARNLKGFRVNFGGDHSEIENFPFRSKGGEFNSFEGQAWGEDVIVHEFSGKGELK